MRFGDLMNKAKRMVDKRGGTGALKEDAQELRDIARGGGSAQDKAKRAAEALKDPGAPGGERGEHGGERPAGGAERRRESADAPPQRADAPPQRADAPPQRADAPRESADRPGEGR